MNEDHCAPSRIYFRERLTPHRSLSPGGFRWVMTGVVAFSLAVSTGLFWAGAWPAFGFLGLDIAFFYWALRVGGASERISETLELNERALVVERQSRRGGRARWDLSPAWLRIDLQEPVAADTPMILRTHGRSVAIGGFLAPEERLALAERLRAALDAWRTA